MGIVWRGFARLSASRYLCALMNSPALRLMSLSLCFLTWAALPGCRASRERSWSEVLTASEEPREPDIPVPASFRFADGVSEDYRSGRRRLYVRHRYLGSADKQAVRLFYQREMPRVRWTMISNANLHGYYVLRFHKGMEACEITIKDGPGGAPTVLDIRITALERAGTPSALEGSS